MMLQHISSLLGVAAMALSTGASMAAAQQQATAPDSAAIVGAVDRFHQALATGDSLGALALLTQNVVVLESGGFETRAEFRNHHLPADIDFARSTQGERIVRSVAQRG